MAKATRLFVAPGPGLETLLVLSLPSLLFAGFDLARRSYLPVFLASERGVSLAETAVFVAVTGAWGVLVEFLVSVVGDSASRQRNPRVFWMVWGTVLIVVATLALLMVSGGGGAIEVAIVVLALITGWTLCNVTHGAWALETGRAARERSAIFGMRGFFAIAGGTCFAVLAAAINRGAVPGTVSPFIAILVVTGLGIPVLHGWLILRLGRQPGLRTVRSPARSLLEPLRTIMANAGHRRLALLYGLVGLNGGVSAATFLIVARDGLGLAAWADLILGVYTASAALGALASARWGALWCNERMLGGLMVAKVGLGLAILVVPAGRPEWLALWAIAGGGVASFNLLSLRLLLGEALDQAGTSSETAQGALFYAAFHIPLNIGLAAGGALALASLDWVGFDPGANRFEQTSYLAVRIPGVALALSALAGVLAVHGLDRLRSKHF